MNSYALDVALFVGSVGLFTWKITIHKNIVVAEKQKTSLTDKNVLLAIDIGSSSVRCGGFIIVGGCSIQHIDYCDATIVKGTVEGGFANAQELLLDVSFVVDSCLQKLRTHKLQDIKYVCITCFAMSLVGVSENEEACTRVLTYAGESTESLNWVPTKTEIFNHYMETGTILTHPCYAPKQLKEYYETNSVPDCVTVWQTLSGYILGKWCGISAKSCPISLSDASWTGLLNIHTVEWSREALKFAGVVNKFGECECDNIPLPPLNKTATPLHGISESWLASTSYDWSELRHAKFFSGIPDGVAANIASKCVISASGHSESQGSKTTCRRFAITIGTSSAVRVMIPFSEDLLYRAGVVCPGLWVYRTSMDTVIVGGALTDGGSLVKWLSSFVGPERIIPMTASIEQQYRDGVLFQDNGSSYPLVLPFWAGERAVEWHSNARGSIHGIGRETTPECILLALMEGTIIRLAEILRRLRIICSSDEDEDCIVVSGAVLEKHWTWRQILADMCDLPVVMLKPTNGEITMRGAALQAIASAGASTAPIVPVAIESCVFGLDSTDVEIVHLPNTKYRDFWSKRKEYSGKIYNIMSTTWESSRK